MRSITAFILLTVLLSHTYSRYMLLLNYEVNKTYFAKNLCINRAKPDNGCHGRCFLKKQLAKAAAEEGASNRNSRVEKDETLFLFEVKKMTPHFFAEANSRQFMYRNHHLISQNAGKAIFQPPRLL